MAIKTRYSLNKNKYLLDPEYDRLYSLLRSHQNSDSRNCLLLFLALHTGARAQELLNITFKDLNEVDRSIFIRGIKGSNDREIPLPEWLFNEVLGLKEGRGIELNDESSIFMIGYQRLVQIWHLYRPVHKSFHSLRHSFAIRLYKKTKDIRLVQVALGHRNITNTMIYADYVYSQEELRKLIL